MLSLLGEAFPNMNEQMGLSHFTFLRYYSQVFTFSSRKSVKLFNFFWGSRDWTLRVFPLTFLPRFFSFLKFWAGSCWIAKLPRLGLSLLPSSCLSFPNCREYRCPTIPSSVILFHLFKIVLILFVAPTLFQKRIWSRANTFASFM